MAINLPQAHLKRSMPSLIGGIFSGVVAFVLWLLLFGTGSVAHLKSNIASILSPPLPAADVARLTALFGHLVGVGLDLPDRMQQGEVRRSP